MSVADSIRTFGAIAAAATEAGIRAEAGVSVVFGCPCNAGYGLTETSPVATTARRKGTVVYADEASRLRHQATAGWPLPGVSIRVVRHS